MTKKHVTTEMRWIDWDYLKRLATPVKEVVDTVYDRCQERMKNHEQVALS